MVIEQLEIHRWKRKEEKAEGDGEGEEPWLKFDFLYKN